MDHKHVYLSTLPVNLLSTLEFPDRNNGNYADLHHSTQKKASLITKKYIRRWKLPPLIVLLLFYNIEASDIDRLYKLHDEVVSLKHGTYIQISFWQDIYWYLHIVLNFWKECEGCRQQTVINLSSVCFSFLTKKSSFTQPISKINSAIYVSSHWLVNRGLSG